MLHPEESKLIVALDVAAPEQALRLVRELRAHVSYFKVGLQLFTASGPDIVGRILGEGAGVFLDLKFHDIPNTVAQAVLEAARLGVHMMTLHTQGGEAMMRQARQTLSSHSGPEGWAVPKLLGVTVLTSLDEKILGSLGIRSSVENQVVRLARLAQGAGMDGLVASPWELPLLRQQGLEKLLLVTPGIRSSPEPADDQVRTATAARAIAQGADFVVVGRPIIRSARPAEAAQSILEQIDAAGTYQT